MKKYDFDLQLFADNRVQGKKLVYLFRLFSERSTAQGTVVAFTTENSRSKSKDAEITQTKDGAIRTPGTAEVEITATAFLASGDPMIGKLEDAMDSDGKIEIWEANIAEPASEYETNKYKGRYFQGYLTSIEYSSNAEDYVEVSLTFAVEGSGAKGDVTVSAEQQALAEYVFTDTVTSDEE